MSGLANIRPIMATFERLVRSEVVALLIADGGLTGCRIGPGTEVPASLIFAAI
jgi:hypothetical protein